MCMQNSGTAGWLTNPVATAFGENSTIAKINKAAIDPGGVAVSGPSIIDDIVPTNVRDPLKIGDAKREQEAQNKAIIASYLSGSSDSSSSSSSGKAVLGA